MIHHSEFHVVNQYGNVLRKFSHYAMAEAWLAEMAERHGAIGWTIKEVANHVTH